MKNVLIIIVISAVLASCTKKPEAIFDSGGHTILTTYETKFNNESKNAESFEWDFGDGGTSFEQNPSYTFDKSGTYDVSLTAISKSGKHSDTYSQTINVLSSNKQLILNSWRYETQNIYAFQSGVLVGNYDIGPATVWEFLNETEMNVHYYYNNDPTPSETYAKSWHLNTEDTLYIDDIRYTIINLNNVSLEVVSDTTYDTSVIPTVSWVTKLDFYNY
jgi:PKD repeat protein